MVRTEVGTARWRTSSVIADGTVLRSVTSPAAAKFGTSSALAARITLPPQANVTKISNTERSKEIEVAARTPAKSAGVKTVRAQHAKATALRCSIATAFGRPVEPEV